MIAMRITFTTVISLTIGSAEAEHVCRVTGSYSKGYRGDRRDPPEDPSFEVETIEVPIAICRFGRPTGQHTFHDITELLADDQIAELAEQGVMAAVADADEAHERRAEMRREDLAI